MVMFSVIRKVGFWDSAMPIWVYLGIFSGCGVWFSGFLVCGLVILGLVLSDPTGSGRFRDWLSGLVAGQFGCVCGGRPGQPFPFVFLHPTSRFELFCSVGFLFLQFPLYLDYYCGSRLGCVSVVLRQSGLPGTLLFLCGRLIVL